MWVTRSQFERVEAHLQQRAEQKLGQTQARDRGRSWGRNRDRGRGRGRELGQEDKGGKENEASAESLFEHQQEVSNGEGFYEMFEIWYECDM